MAVPKYFEMYQSFFRALADRKEHPYIDVKNQVIKDFGLSADDVSELLPSGRQSVFNNRIGWCRTYLKKAGLIESPSRAHFAITNAGKKLILICLRRNDVTYRAKLRQEICIDAKIL
jgi:restriction system protein